MTERGLARGLSALVLSLGLVLGPTVPAAAEPVCEFSGVDRIVAVGDVHGAYDHLVEILRAADLIDVRGRWSGGRAHLVQLGDVLDRGPDSRKALDLIRQLQKEAASAGGRVHALLGNHEAMRMMGDDRYTTAGELAAFGAEDGRAAMIQAFGPRGSYGSFLRSLNAVELIDDVVFAHGGISPAVASMPCLEINTRVRKDLASDLEKTIDAPENSLAAREDGPLWYRGLATEPESFAPNVRAILDAQRARAIVVAHTVLPSGRIDVRFGGTVFVIDTGMQTEYMPTGRASALEIRGGVVTAIYTDRRDVIGRLSLVHESLTVRRNP